MAETRETQVLEDAVESTEIENPRTTEEAILAKIIAGEEVNINARTRYQAYLKELSSISGGNPNYVETITGTLANPLGDSTYTYADLLELQIANAVTMKADIKASAIGEVDFWSYLYVNYNPELAIYSLLLSGVFDAGDTANDWSAFVYTLVSPGPDTALLLTKGVVTDLSAYLGLIPTVLTIIHHPLPEEDNT